jgi:hypothetical protein
MIFSGLLAADEGVKGGAGHSGGVLAAAVVPDDRMIESAGGLRRRKCGRASCTVR